MGRWESFFVHRLIPCVCVSVQSAQLGECSLSRRLSVTAASGYITSLQAENHGLGGSDCPWSFKAKPGQTFHFYFLNFTPSSPGDGVGESPRPGCFELAVITEGEHSQSITTCDGAVRSSPIYSSDSHQVGIQMASSGALASLGKFLIQFEGNHVILVLIE